MVRSRADDPLAALTPREREVLAAMAEGRTNLGIARLLTSPRRDREAHRQHLRKLDLPQSEDDHRFPVICIDRFRLRLCVVARRRPARYRRLRR